MSLGEREKIMSLEETARDNKSIVLQKSIERMEIAIHFLENVITEIKEGGKLGVMSSPALAPRNPPPMTPIAIQWDNMPAILDEYSNRIQKVKDNLMEVFF